MSALRRKGLPRLSAVVGISAVAALAFAPTATSAPTSSAHQYLSARPQQYSVFLDLARRAGVEPFLRSSRRRTFFVPTNRAFAQLPPRRLALLRQPRRRTELRRLLLAAIADRAQAPALLRRGITLLSINRHRLEFARRGTRVALNGTALISRAGVRVRNGRVYTVSSALAAGSRERLSTTGGQPVACGKWSQDASWVKCTAYASPGDATINLFSVVDGITDDGIAPGITKDSLVYVVAYGAGGNVGRQNGAYKAGSGGLGGSALTATSPNIVLSNYGDVDVAYYVGAAGASGAGNQASGGGGGASTIATMMPPGRRSKWDPPLLGRMLVIAGGGGGGGGSGTSHDGGGGGSGGRASATQFGNAVASGAGGSGGKKSHGGGGGNGSGGSGGCGQPNCVGGSGIGGFGGAGNQIGGLSGPGWLNAPFYLPPTPQASSGIGDDWVLTPGAGGSGFQGTWGGSVINTCSFAGPPPRICGGGGGGGFGGGGGGDWSDSGINNAGGGGGGGSWAIRSACEPGSETSKIDGVPGNGSSGRLQLYFSPEACVT